ncbi:hypothetical protein AN958_04128 [Leucoagaricus sp. SymC.cos]|nr:hypothetical protein AN958_04128 [Leucoagaricus sp. SymC.cos]
MEGERSHFGCQFLGSPQLLLGFLKEEELPEAKSLSERARTMLFIKDKDIGPTAVLEARRKIICPDCTVDASRPVMIEQGQSWEIHQRTRPHQRLRAKREREKQLSNTGNAQLMTPQ